MKKHLPFTAAFLALASYAFAATDHKSHHAKSGSAEAAADAYPLKTCIVSDEPLGSMGDSIAYTHQEPGKPDRVVRFCCEGCIEDFKAEPAKFLKKLDAAEAAAKQPRARKKKSA